MLKLLGNTALLAPHKNTQTGGGILLSPKYAYADNMQWTVLGVGPGKRIKGGSYVVPELLRGQRCLYNLGLSGTKHTLSDGTIIVDIDNILMVWS